MREKATNQLIAADLGRSPTTVSKEIRHNCAVLHGYRNSFAVHRPSGRW
ncbi:helix-turn-helix domain-containing protein [Streptomyces sp. NPDC005529]